VTDVQLLKAHQHLPEPIQPGEVRSTQPSGAPDPADKAGGVAAPRWVMGAIPTLDHRGPGGLPVYPYPHTSVPARRAGHDHSSSVGVRRRHVMPIRPADDYRQRDSTGVHEETAFRALFFPDPSGWDRRPLGPGGFPEGRIDALPCPGDASSSSYSAKPCRQSRTKTRRASRRGSICG